jgi:hypothetical protein
MNTTATAPPVCRVVLEHLTGERETIWSSSDPNYLQLLDAAAGSLRQQVAGHFYVVEVIIQNPPPVRWEVCAYRF